MLFFAPFSLCVISKFPSCIVVHHVCAFPNIPPSNLMTSLHKCLKLFPLQNSPTQ